MYQFFFQCFYGILDASKHHNLCPQQSRINLYRISKRNPVQNYVTTEKIRDLFGHKKSTFIRLKGMRSTDKHGHVICEASV